MVAKGKLTKEEELLLQDFSRNVSKKSSIIFYFNALIVSAIPIWLFWRIHMMDPLSSAAIFGLVTAIATYLVAFAYMNTKFVLKHKVAQKVEDAVTREVMRKLSDDKKMAKKEKDESLYGLGDRRLGDKLTGRQVVVVYHCMMEDDPPSGIECCVDQYIQDPNDIRHLSPQQYFECSEGRWNSSVHYQQGYFSLTQVNQVAVD
ncbi:Translocon-associated protein subunit gamma [Portunus trituberculatus]|uniref:Translocon-associated protein subunit gamma n=1 Tax=Portunus trituberculatus TaxID=210409 RepID=A0A5B7EQ99_PORTR|nr:Translocon-associated protein subunit gamma [Portunus trituberculatus]